ncbi:MAG: hypothetical protein HYS45_03045 [Parcubacteria group bacterium]|nr:hypothetical protein [Parcubacteria group bacterium]
MDNFSQTNSILDKVMAVKQEEDLASFNPVEIISKLFSELGSREQDILRRRFGLHGKGNETLEQIGKNYQVTRERVRQIENAAIRNIRGFSYFEATVKPVEMVVLAALEKHGGIMSEEHMLEYVLQGEQSDEAYCKHLLFLLEKLTKNRIVREQRQGFNPSWRIDFVDWERVEQTIGELERILSAHGQPITRDELLQKFRETSVFADHQSHFNFDPKEAHPIHAHLRATTRIRPNPFGDWGLSHWNTVTPKRMGDKIYLVMKKHGEPLHFRDIAEHINKAGFDEKRAYPPTVHNELILDERYVLVGRGIYGLKEWGFVPGVVSDVIFSILQKEPSGLSRDAIVDEVLKQRMVKKGTVYLALGNDQRFKKDAEGRFSAVDGIRA